MMSLPTNSPADTAAASLSPPGLLRRSMIQADTSGSSLVRASSMVSPVESPKLMHSMTPALPCLS